MMKYQTATLLPCLLVLFLISLFLTPHAQSHEHPSPSSFRSIVDDSLKDLQGRYNQHNDAWPSIDSISALSGVALVATVPKISEPFHHLFSSHAKVLKEIFTSYPPKAVDGTTSEVLFFKGKALLQAVQNSLSRFHQPSLQILSRYGLLIICSAKTVQTIYELYSFESIFAQSDIVLNDLRKLYQTDVSPKVSIMVQALTQMAEHIGFDIGLNKTVTDNDKKVPRNYVEHLFITFNDHYEKVEQLLSHINNEIQLFAVKAEQEKLHYDKAASTSKRTALVSAGYVALSSLLAVVFPPATPFVAASKLSYVVGGLVASINTGISYLSDQNSQRITHRIEQFQELHGEIDKVKSSISLYYYQYEKLRQILEQRMSDAASAPFNFDVVMQGLQTLLQCAKDNLFTILSLSVIGVLTYAFILYIKRNEAKILSHDKPFRLILMISVFMMGTLLILVFIDIIEGVYRTKLANVHLSKQHLSVEHNTLRERYKHECIWHEVPTVRKISLELKAFFWTVIGQDGYRNLARNATGHLVNDDVCLKYLQLVEKSSDVHAAENVGKVYVGGLMKGFTSSAVEIIAHGLEVITHQTSFYTKIYLGALAVICFLLLVKKVFWCC